MDLWKVIVTVVIVGFALWGVNTYIPMQKGVQKVLNIAVVVILILWLIKVSEVLKWLADIKL